MELTPSRPVIALFVLLLLPLATDAQQPQLFPPAAELKKVERLVGNWRGKGTVAMVPDAPPVSWDARSTGKWVLGGHAIQHEMQVTFSDVDIPAIRFRSYLGWDRARKRFVSWGMDNLGNAGPSELSLADANTFISIRTAVEDGSPVVERSVHRFAGEDYSLKIVVALS